jgi:hypothetical protein
MFEPFSNYRHSLLRDWMFFIILDFHFTNIMDLTTQIAKHIKDIHFGGNWTCSNLKDALEDLTWQQATAKVYSFNTIAALTYHVNYFVGAALDVLQGKPLTAKDIYSFDHPPIHSQEDWSKLLEEIWTDAEKFSILVEQMPKEKIWEDFWDEKYGNYYRNLHGIVEHMHYHLGQIVLIRKIIQEKEIEKDDTK